MRLIIVNGYARAGKDTFINICRDIIGDKYSMKISIIDPVKDIAKYCGWDGRKTDKTRKFLCDLKDLLSEWGDVPFMKICTKIDEFQWDMEHYGVSDKAYVFVIMREKCDADRLVERYKCECTNIYKVFINGGEHNASNRADMGVVNEGFDFTINNDSSISDLEKKAKNFIDTIKGD